MIDKNRIIPVATLLLVGMVVAGPLVGFTDGQILTEKTYYEEDFEQYNESAVQLVSSSELQNQHLTDTGKWDHNYFGGVNNYYGIRYGDSGTHVRVQGVDTRQPFLSIAAHRYDHQGWGGVGGRTTIDIPDGISDPVLVAETGAFSQYNRDNIRLEVGAENQVRTFRAYDSSPGSILQRPFGDVSTGDFRKTGSIPRTQEQAWQTHVFDVSQAENNTTFYIAGRDNSRNNHHMGVFVRNLYIADGSPDAFQSEVEEYSSVPEDDSFGGPDPYRLALVNAPTAEGEETSLRSHGSTITRDFTLDGISTNPQKVYFELDGTSQSHTPVNWRIEQYGQEVASGSISPYSSAEDTAELNLNDDEFTLYIESAGQYEVHDVTVTALEETSEGDPLASEGPVVLDAQSGYDKTIGVFINALDLTTSTLLYIVMIALIIGAMAFSYTKSVRGQEFGQSMMYGAIITGVVMVGLVPTMNAATWIFTGGTDRAPLANPSLEAEPPTYYSTEFQAGTMDGWENVKGMARPVSSGEGFNLDMTADGQSAVVQRKVHISLGNSLDTGFVRLGATASSTPGYTSNPHETSLRMRVYVTDGEEPNWASKTSDLTDADLSTYDDLVVAQEWARSFDGQVVNEEGTVSFPLEGNTIYVEIVATDNRNDELATGSVNWIAVGATTEGTGEAV